MMTNNRNSWFSGVAIRSLTSAINVIIIYLCSVQVNFYAEDYPL